MNYFASAAAAERYAAGRPDVHARTMSQIRSYLGLTDLLDTALDVACGTGLSTGVLRSVAARVYGADISSDMLRMAPSVPEPRPARRRLAHPL